MSIDVLLAEVDPSLRQKAARILRKEKLSVAFAGDNTVESVKASRPGLILLDLEQCRAEVLETVRTIHEASPRLPIVVLSDPKRDGSLVENALERGAVDFLVRPFVAFELRLRVGRLLRRGPVSFELHDPATGRLDAARIASSLGLPLRRLALALGKNYKAVHRSPSTRALQPLLEPIAATISTVSRFFDRPEEVRAWFNTPHPDLGGRTALSLIEEGRAEIVRDMVEAASSGTPT